MKKDFELFKKEFSKWQRKFGLTGYKVYFKYEPLESFADITVTQSDMVATARLNSDVSTKEIRDARQSAKHEAIHLLLMKVEHRAKSRYIREEELDESVEELVFKLEDLIGNP